MTSTSVPVTFQIRTLPNSLVWGAMRRPPRRKTANTANCMTVPMMRRATCDRFRARSVVGTNSPARHHSARRRGHHARAVPVSAPAAADLDDRARCSVGRKHRPAHRGGQRPRCSRRGRLGRANRDPARGRPARSAHADRVIGRDFCVLLYSLGQGHADGDEEVPVSIYHPTYLVLAAGVANTFLAGDLFNLFVGFEILLAASFVLLTLGGSRSRIRAGTVYVVVAIVASTLFLVAIGLIYAATGTVNLAQLSVRLAEIDSGLAIACELLLLLAFGVKAAVFPLSAWLPDSYPSAPASVTAVFAGLLTKVGVYAILRTETLLFPGEQLRSLLLVAALATMIVGILGALAQSDLKRMLSFTLVSHIGFMLFGIGLASEAGLAGSVFYVVHHITVQTVLFLVAGLVERHGGTTSLERLGGLARLAPFLALLFFISAMNLAGIPPMSGFLGKVGLLQAGIETGTP